MIARVSSGKAGIGEYLEEGLKQGREQSRDELDEREILEGNLDLTKSIIKEMGENSDSDNYLHITLSFAEKYIDSATMLKAYGEYKDKVFAAYDSSEFNVYAEIHHPKVKSYIDQKTGDSIERFPHVHIVVPTKNLATGKAMNPFGRYQNNVEHHDAIQEHVNRHLKLESPYDNQRGYRFTGKNEILSRHKGDEFKGANREVKSAVLSRIHDKDIRSVDALKRELVHFGEVGTGRESSGREYLKVKPHGQEKFIRLKEPFFTHAYISDRLIERQKPTDKKVAQLVDEWVSKRAFEMKHIHAASPSFRKKYYSANVEEKELLLNDRIEKHSKTNNLRQRRRKAYHKPRLERDRTRTFAYIPNGLPSVLRRNVDSRGAARTANTQSVLSSNASHHLDSHRAGTNHKLRRFTARPGRRVKTLPEQLAVKNSYSKVSETERAAFQEIRLKLKAERLLEHLKVSHGVDPTEHPHFQSKRGGARIKANGRSLNVSDFLTKHMHLTWEEAKSVLTECYENQQQSNQERHAVNSLAFASSYVTDPRKSSGKLSRLDESIMVFRLLKAREKYGDTSMSLQDLKAHRTAEGEAENTLSEQSKLSVSNLNDVFRRQRELADSLTLKMSDVVAVKDMKKGKVEYNDATTGKKLFVDRGERLEFDRKPDDNSVAVGLALAAEKFGKVKVKGNNDFKQQVLEIAVSKDLKIVFDDKKMQEQFTKMKDELKANKELEQLDSKTKNAPEQGATSVSEKMAEIKAKRESEESASTSQPKQEGREVVDFGKAPYEFNDKNKESYFVEFADGKQTWGVGLKDTLEGSNVQKGDFIRLEMTGKEPVTTSQPVFNDKGDYTGEREIQTHRNTWKVDKFEKVDTLAKGDVNISSISESAKKSVENSSSYKLDFKYSPDEGKLMFTVNGKKPNEVLDRGQADQLRKNDPFLSKYQSDNILDGKLDLKLAGDAIDKAQPRTLDSTFKEITKTSTITESHTMTR